MAEYDEGNSNLLYHERQVAKLCGMHCLNSLLQGPYFTEIDLASIAEGLDSQEREMMMESGASSADFLKFMAEDSGNVAADGNFSIQVLTNALEVWNLKVLPLTSPDAASSAADPLQEDAFICHMQSHWFTIRKMRGEWYNLNSLYAAPEHLSQFYLSLYLDSLQQEGWTIFVVKGSLPHPSTDVTQPSESGRWFSPSEAKAALEVAKREEASEGESSRGADLLLNATKAVEGKEMKSWGVGQRLGGGGEEADGLLKLGEVAGMAEGGSMEEEDPELAAAITASLEEDGERRKKEWGEGTSGKGGEDEKGARGREAVRGSEGGGVGMGADVELAFRLPDGTRVRRMFSSESALHTVVAFLKERGVDVSKYGVAEAGPGKQLLADYSCTLRDAGLVHMSTLVVRPR